MHDFKIGDMLRSPMGVGKLVAIDVDGWFGVEYSTPTGVDHDCNGAGRKGYCYWHSPRVTTFELVQQPAPVAKPKLRTFVKGSQCDLILKYMLGGRKITPMVARQLFGTERLAARILEIRQSGHKVKSTLKTDPNGKVYAEYSLRKVDRFGRAA